MQVTDEMVEAAATGIDPVLFGIDANAAHYRASPVDLEYARNTARSTARAAIAAALPLIRGAVVEECAKVAAYGVQRAYRDFNDRKIAEGAQAMAAEILEAIRALSPREAGE